MMNLLPVTCSMFALILIFLTACGDDGTILANRKVVFPDSNVSYLHQVEPFMRINCSYKGCHSLDDRAGNRDLSSYYSFFLPENAGLVLIGKPDESRLIQILKGKPEHSGYYTFPSGYFSENHINGMSTWIRAGAKDN